MNLVFIPIASLSGWNKLKPDIRNSQSISFLIEKRLSLIRPSSKPAFCIYDPIGLTYLSQIRVGLSKLNYHKFKHNFRDTVNPLCPTNDGVEDTEHYLLLCPSFERHRRVLLAGVLELSRPFVDIKSLSKNDLTQLLLYGDVNLSYDVNKNILKMTLDFIHKTGRFD